jgi:hypothetical protein
MRSPYKKPNCVYTQNRCEIVKVWRVRVLEFVLERECFYSPFAIETIFEQKRISPS